MSSTPSPPPSPLPERESYYPTPPNLELLTLYNQAMEAYDRALYSLAIDNFAQVVLKFIEIERLTEADQEIFDNSLQMAVAAYKNIDPACVDKILATEDDDEVRFSAIYRHYQDYRVHSPEEVAQEIYRDIPCELSDPQDTTYPEGEGNLETAKIQHIETATASAQGPRSYMEDAHLIHELKLDSETFCPLLTLFDGHGDTRCALYSKDHLPAILQSELQGCKEFTDTEIYHLLCRTFVKLDKEWKEQTDSEDRSGTTALAALFIQDALWIANVGDSRAVLIRGNQAIQLSEDAKPPIEKYRKEIVLRGGKVFSDRVDGNLDMARSIGDNDNPSVSARPEITKFELNLLERDSKHYLILACDGLWDVVSPADTAQICKKFDTLAEIAKTLKDEAFAKGTYDNVTVMVIKPNL